MSLKDAVKDCLRELSGWTKQCGLHAFEHLEKAQALAELDPEMAIFRAITAEEEAATVLFITLKQRQYNGAKQIQHRSHLYKQGLFPFLVLIRDYIGSVEDQLPEKRWRKVEDDDGKARLIWEFEGPGGLWGRPDHPFNMMLSSGETGDPYHFERELDRFAKETAEGDVKKYLNERANQRNRLLYASESGIPRVTDGVERNLKEQEEKVVAICAIACMIAPYRERGIFAQQCLNAFLYLMDKLSKDDLETMDYGIRGPVVSSP